MEFQKDDSKEEAENQEPNPWDGLNYTIDVETGKYNWLTNYQKPKKHLKNPYFEHWLLKPLVV